MAIWLMVAGRDAPPAAPPAAVGSIIRSPAMPDTPVVQESNWWVLNQDHALAELLAVLDVPYDGALYPCWVAGQQGFKCENQKARTWEEFKLFNRPAVLTITTPSRHTAYVTLI